MVPVSYNESTLDPIELFTGTLERAWRTLRKAYDVTAGMPEMETLFYHVDLADPDTAAQGVLVNMLTEITEQVGRFSPWYTKPARAFGLTSVTNKTTYQTQWILAPEAIQKWQCLLQPLVHAIRSNSGLLQAIFLIDKLMEDIPEEDPYVIVSCQCTPKRRIRVKLSVLAHAELACEDCHQPFR